MFFKFDVCVPIFGFASFRSCSCEHIGNIQKDIIFRLTQDGCKTTPQKFQTTAKPIFTLHQNIRDSDVNRKKLF